MDSSEEQSEEFWLDVVNLMNSSESRYESGDYKGAIEDKLKESEEKLLRSLAEIENQRRRFEKEIKDAFEDEVTLCFVPDTPNFFEISNNQSYRDRI